MIIVSRKPLGNSYTYYGPLTCVVWVAVMVHSHLRFIMHQLLHILKLLKKMGTDSIHELYCSHNYMHLLSTDQPIT